MRCPYCNKELIILERCFMNAYTYHNNCLAHTACCGRGVMIHPITDYEIYKYTGEKLTDDWGSKN